VNYSVYLNNGLEFYLQLFHVYLFFKFAQTHSLEDEATNLGTRKWFLETMKTFKKNEFNIILIKPFIYLKNLRFKDSD